MGMHVHRYLDLYLPITDLMARARSFHEVAHCMENVPKSGMNLFRNLSIGHNQHPFFGAPSLSAHIFRGGGGADIVVYGQCIAEG